jgi:hypothetical protein
MSVSLYGSGQTVLQVVSVVNPSTFSTSSSSYVTTGTTASITPQSTTSKILVIYGGEWNIGASSVACTLQVYRNGSSVSGVIAGQYSSAGGSLTATMPIVYLDSPSTTSSTTYTIYAASTGAAGTITLSANSTITLLEISGS